MDPTTTPVTVGVGPLRLVEAADVRVSAGPGAGIAPAVRHGLEAASVVPEEVRVAFLVVRSDGDGDERPAMAQEITDALGHGPVVFIDTIEARLRGHLGGIPDVPPVVAAVLVAADIHRGERPSLDLDRAAALAVDDRECFVRWAIELLDGLIEDRDVGGDPAAVLWCPARNTADREPLLAVVETGAVDEPALVADLARRCAQVGAAGGVLVSLREPSTAVVTAAAALGDREVVGGQRHPALELLPVADLLAGRRPLALESGEESLRSAVRRRAALAARVPEGHVEQPER